MKLNLLPTYVSKEKQARFAIFIAAALLLGSVGASVYMASESNRRLEKAKAPIAELQTLANTAKSTADSANDVVAEARQVLLNVNLANAMNQHNYVYPRFYDGVRRYIPSFFRVTSMSAQPIDDSKAQLTMQGVIKTYQEYADLMLALLRIPGAQSVGRSGFQNNPEKIPGLTPNDQQGLPTGTDAANAPKDPEARINYYASQATEETYNPAGGYGTSSTAAKGAMPGYSQITVSIVINSTPALNANLRTPDPRATLAQSVAPGGK